VLQILWAAQWLWSFFNARATVTICNSKTQDLSTKLKQADVVVVAVGIPQMIKGDWIKEGATVIDVGINRLDDGKLVGDVDFDALKTRLRGSRQCLAV